ncbi:MAG TPA: glycoside hydrolase family 32 protein [Puia sp.]|jgi:fructan beta-fructosidase
MSKTDTMLRRMLCMFTFLACLATLRAQNDYNEPYRPQLHFSPRTSWMNDPNGLVYFDKVYHLFYQYFPDSTVWGPMHWGHATSKDLLHWKQEAIALYPDSLGYIFSGSVVIDSTNSGGFGVKSKIPMVAVFTQHDPAGEKAGTNLFQNQSIAYSLDKGSHWQKYKGNPVLKTPGLKDFRDPKVRWYVKGKKWIMVLAAGDRVMFYSSKNLKEWKKESDFGAGMGAHGGVWECPDLIPFIVKGKKIWLLIVSINPGAPQGGSGTQYFTGDFDGHQFISNDTLTRWLDYGADDYAGVSFSNTGNEKIFIGWMSNWQYATKVPTGKWRSAMTIPRILDLKKIGQHYFTSMTPVSLKPLGTSTKVASGKIKLQVPYQIDISISDLHSFTIVYSNSLGQELRIGFDEQKNAFFADRTRAGKSDFDPQFAAIHYAPRIAKSKESSLTVILDNSSLELFADDGLTSMTEIFFPEQPFNEWHTESNAGLFDPVRLTQLKSIWTAP